jgi:hypothetical protein
MLARMGRECSSRPAGLDIPISPRWRGFRPNLLLLVARPVVFRALVSVLQRSQRRRCLLQRAIPAKVAWVGLAALVLMVHRVLLPALALVTLVRLLDWALRGI